MLLHVCTSLFLFVCLFVFYFLKSGIKFKRSFFETAEIIVSS